MRYLNCITFSIVSGLMREAVIVYHHFHQQTQTLKSYNLNVCLVSFPVSFPHLYISPLPIVPFPSPLLFPSDADVPSLIQSPEINQHFIRTPIYTSSRKTQRRGSGEERGETQKRLKAKREKGTAAQKEQRVKSAKRESVQNRNGNREENLWNLGKKGRETKVKQESDKTWTEIGERRCKEQEARYQQKLVM